MSEAIPSMDKNYFNDYFKLSLGNKDQIIDCKAKVSNIFTKIISENQLGVYGDYTVYIFYNHNLKENDNKYKVKKIGKTFGEIIECKDMLDYGEEKVEPEKLSYKLSYKCDIDLSCQLSKEDGLKYGLVYILEITGEIKFSYLSEKVKFNKAQKNKDEGLPLKAMKSKVWSHKLNKNDSINEILDMDEKTFKERFKNS